MRGGADVDEGASETCRSEQVHLDRPVERRVERDGRGGVDHEVARCERGASFVVEPQSVATDIARHDRHAPVEHRREVVAVRGAQRVERVVLEDLAVRPLLHGRAPAGPQQQHDVRVGHRSQQPFEQRGAEEAGCAGHGDAPAPEGLGDAGDAARGRGHPLLSTSW
jgi:hypothetical protein